VTDTGGVLMGRADLERAFTALSYSAQGFDY
jgi:hypothetical protein